MYDLMTLPNHLRKEWFLCSFYQWGNGDTGKIIHLPKVMQLRVQAVKSNGFVPSQTCYLVSATESKSLHLSAPTLSSGK